MPSPFRRDQSARPLVFGHRGARHAAPENTMPAFELAADEGADGVELDVRLAGSGEVVVFHDPTLWRLSGESDPRAVEDLSFRELATQRFAGAPIPLLEQVLDWAALRGMLVNVELKSDLRGRDRLLETVRKLLAGHRAGAERVILSSFDPRFVRWLSRNLPQIPVGWLVHARQRLFRGAAGHRLLGASAVHPEHVLATQERVAKWRARGALVNVWTVNEPGRARSLAELGVDAIISDVPGAVLAALR